MKGVGNAVIPTFPTCWSYCLQHLRHKRPTFAFAGESGYTLAFANRIAHSGLHAETRAVSDGGRYLHPRTVPHVRKPPRAGYQKGVLCRFWALAEGAPEERREPAEQRCAYARRCPKGVAAPPGCVIFFAFVKIGICTSCAQGLSACARQGGITTLGTLCMFSKRWTAACQKGLFAVF